ncbi:serine/arginine repetitive matrix protein [Parasponia andersonii]|uniref:Serine/arginine repetitive matrix protein n=1 Tax=Parasponia andersonii TaxID=3476 RepID=A0A2P5ASA4_PARAD|nr:serine/arginine repetitive matrix protein [Parasponia andersonii]
MATSGKFDISGSPDRPLYISGQRGSHIAPPLDRSGSFRDSVENPILSSLPNMSRSSSTVPQGDLLNFFHCLRFDPKAVAADHKSLRQVDFKRHVNVALGISPDESPSGSTKGKTLSSPSPEEIKRVKAGLRESIIKARERVKLFHEALSVFNKFFSSVPSKKRSRSEGFPSDRSGSVLSSDRSGLGPSIGKIGIQSHSIPGSFELEQQKSEERTKTALPNKRTRTSFVDAKMDARSNALVRPSGIVDRDREMLRLANSGAVQGEDRTSSIGVDGWEKSKMKKKRSVIKPDVSPSTLSTKPIDGYRETKQGMQQRPIADARSRLNNDSHGFRPGVTSGVVGVGKSDGLSQQTGLGIRSSIPRTDPDNSSSINDKRDRPIGSDKERVNLRAVNKANVRDDLNSGSPISNSKVNASVRAPRSSTGVVPKLSPVVHRATVSNDWEVSHCTNKPPSGVGANNRKRMASARSSSPPVANWAGQRPQKNSRTARRSNFGPIVSNNDETPAMDSPSDVTGTGNDVGLGYAKRLPGSSPQQVKLKSEPLSSAALSESEESGAAEIKSRDKGKKSDDVDEKAGQTVQKVSPLVLSSRKNKLVTGEDLGDGVRRQGRTGRGFSSTRSLMPMTVEKIGSVGTAKQLRSARLGFDKTESKVGRPPTRKLSDRKAYTRQKHTAINAAADFLVGSDDGHEELLAAANAVVNPGRACSSSFWKQMEPFFGFLSETDITYLKQQGNLESTALTATQVPSRVDACNTVSNGFGLPESESRNDEFLVEQLVSGTGDHNEISLCQRLIAALISEEDYSSGTEDPKVDVCQPEVDFDGGLGSNGLDHPSLFYFQFSGNTAFNGCRIIGQSEQNELETDTTGIPYKAMNSNLGYSLNGLLPDQALMANRTCSEFQYGNMPINEKLLLEIQSIEIFPESGPDITPMKDEEISEEISKLEEKYHEQVLKRKGLLDRLLKSASVAKDHQEKEFEQCALEKLTTMAYEKYMACWGPNTSGKSSGNKMAKQAALAFVKRTLEQCHKYEETGMSCFGEPIFLSGSNIISARQADSTTEGEYSKGFTSIRFLEGRISATMGSQQSPSQFSQNVDNNHDISSDVLMPVNHLSEETIGKEDMWSNRVKKRELSLDDLGNTIGTSSAPSGMGTSLSSSAKGKRSERDRDGKVQNREVLSRNGNTKIGRPSISNVKGERKSKTKPKQKTTQLSVSVNGLLGKPSEHPKPAVPSISRSSEMTTSSNAKEKDDFGLDVLDDPESIDLSHLQLPGMDVLGVPDDLDGQGQDLGSWLNIDDDGLQDHDFMGLEIPMDDLSDLNMMV